MVKQRECLMRGFAVRQNGETKMVGREGLPRSLSLALDPSLAGSVGRNATNVPLARLLDAFPPHRFEPLTAGLVFNLKDGGP